MSVASSTPLFNGVVNRVRPRVRFEDIDITAKGEHVVTMDSEQAAFALQYNTDNRNLRKQHVEHLANMITSGQWRSDHPVPIVFSREGVLLDGQHRLQAIVYAELTDGDYVTVRVITGADPAVREYIDCGLTRAMTDRVKLTGNDSGDKVVVQAAGLHYYLHNNMRTKLTPDDTKNFYETFKDKLDKIYPIRRHEKGTGQAAVVVALMEYMHHDTDKAIAFYVDLFTPAGNVQQAQRLRDHLIRNSGVTGGGQARLNYQAALYCMRQHYRGAQVARIQRIEKWES